VQGNEASWNGNMWVATGISQALTGNTLAYSYDGINWTGLGNTTFTQAALGVAWNGIMWVAMGDDTTISGASIAYSSDGINWTQVLPNPFGTGPNNQRGQAVAWNGTIWVGVGFAAGASPNAIAWSSNGTAWAGITGTTIFNQGLGIAWGNDKWIALGNGAQTMAYSYDGLTWIAIVSPFSSDGYDAVWNGIIWVAVGVGSNTIAYSTDGITWTAVPSISWTRGHSVCWNGVRFIACGIDFSSSAQVKYSQDGINWYDAPNTNIPSFLSTGGWRVRSNSYIGANVFDSQIVLNSHGFRLSNSLDVVSEKYYNNGYTNFSMSVQSNLLP
jgi:hypothetical protein